MILKLAFLALMTFNLATGISQEERSIQKIEKMVASIDSIIIAGDHIGVCIHPFYSDDGGEVFRNDRYTIDTTKRILYKAVYELINFWQVAFYYSNQEVIKAIVSDSSIKAKPYKCEYYFDNDSVFSVKEKGIFNPKNSWDKKGVVFTAEQYLSDFFQCLRPQ
jgi:hypothetical protein